MIQKATFFLVIICCFSLLFACVPQTNTTPKSNNTNTNIRGARTDSRDTKNQPTRTENTRNTRTERNVTTAEQPINEDSVNILRLAEQALRKQTPRPSAQRTSSETNPFQKRQNQLKDVVDERDRFLDTTFFLLKMEDGLTEELSHIGTAGGPTLEYYENLIWSYVRAVEDSERSANFDCNIFKVYENQFNFNDSLRQEATFSLAECLISNGNLLEASVILEELSKEKMNRAVAPKTLVRLGQVHCVLENKSKAERSFRRLKKEFPRSIYNQLADCSKL